MNTNGLAKHYDTFTPEERFRLFVAAGARDDESEQDRLCNAGRRIVLSFPEHWPWMQAFVHVAWFSFAELLEEAAKYDDAWQRWNDATEEAASMPRVKKRQAKTNDLPHSHRMLELLYAQGFMVKVRGDGWKLFCARNGIPPFRYWESLPGMDRVKSALELVEKTDGRPPSVFTQEGMLRFMNRVGAEHGKPEVPPENIVSAEVVAEALDDVFRTMAKHWAGDKS